MAKKITTILLLAALGLSMVACNGENPSQKESDTEPEVQQTDSETETETELTDNLPEKTFDGAEFRMLSYETVGCNGVHVVEEMTGESVNDASFKIMDGLEDRFQITISETLDNNLCLNGIQKTILAGDNAYELIFPNDNTTFSFIQKGCALNYTELPYIDLSRVYWSPELNKSISIAGQLYYAKAAVDLSALDYTHMLTFSKTMATNYNLENFYDLVRNGKWTIDKMQEAMAVVFYDPDSTVDEQTDVYGYVASGHQVLPSFIEAAGEYTIAKDENDVLYYAVPGSEKLSNIIDKVFNVMWDTGYWKVNTTVQERPEDLETLMEEDRTLFTDTTFHNVQKLRELDTDFGLLPYPKYEETQKQYYSRIECSRSPMVPITVEDTDYVSMIMEAMALSTYKYLLPAYYEDSLQGRDARDEESVAMLDIVYNSMVYDLGDTVWIQDIRAGYMMNMFNKNDRDLVSNVEKKREKIESSLAEAMSFYASAD